MLCRFSAQDCGNADVGTVRAVARSAWFNSAFARRLIAAAVFPKPCTNRRYLRRWLSCPCRGNQRRCSEQVVDVLLATMPDGPTLIGSPGIAMMWIGTESTPGMPP